MYLFEIIDFPISEVDEYCYVRVYSSISFIDHLLSGNRWYDSANRHLVSGPVTFKRESLDIDKFDEEYFGQEYRNRCVPDAYDFIIHADLSTFLIFTSKRVFLVYESKMIEIIRENINILINIFAIRQLYYINYVIQHNIELSKQRRSSLIYSDYELSLLHRHFICHVQFNEVTILTITDIYSKEYDKIRAYAGLLDNIMINTNRIESDIGSSNEGEMVTRTIRELLNFSEYFYHVFEILINGENIIQPRDKEYLSGKELIHNIFLYITTLPSPNTKSARN